MAGYQLWLAELAWYQLSPPDPSTGDSPDFSLLLALPALPVAVPELPPDWSSAWRFIEVLSEESVSRTREESGWTLVPLTLRSPEEEVGPMGVVTTTLEFE